MFLINELLQILLFHCHERDWLRWARLLRARNFKWDYLAVLHKSHQNFNFSMDFIFSTDTNNLDEYMEQTNTGEQWHLLSHFSTVFPLAVAVKSQLWCNIQNLLLKSQFLLGFRAWLDWWLAVLLISHGQNQEPGKTHFHFICRKANVIIWTGSSKHIKRNNVLPSQGLWAVAED